MPTNISFNEDQGADRRGACSRGQSSNRETHPGGRGAGLAGDRVWRVLSGAEHDELFVMRLSGCVSGVGWMTLAQAGESGMGKPVPLFLRCQPLPQHHFGRSPFQKQIETNIKASGLDLALEHVASVVHERTAIIT